jgi:signal transduction histidine kinase
MHLRPSSTLSRAVATQPHIQLDALHGLARVLAGGEYRARTVLERTCEALALGFAFERVGIVRFVPESGMLLPFVAYGLSAAEQSALPAALPADRFSAFQRAAASGRTVYVEAPGDEEVVPDEIIRGFGIGSFAIVPLSSDGRCLGFMTCDQRAEYFSLDAAELDLLTTVGTLIGAFLEKLIEREQLRRLNELKSQFAAIASHELRTPAAAIYGAVQTLDTREAQLTPAQLAGLRNMLSVQSKRLCDLVESLLDLSRLDSDSIPIVPTQLSVAERVAALVRAVVGGKKKVEMDVPDGLTVFADPQAFERIVSNLLINAARHGAPPIVISARRISGDFELCVEDHGPGVADMFAASMFEPFTRAGGAAEGAGLGLSIAQSYARAHGGTLGYEPVAPHGARFRLVLPRNVPTR